jgi:hypothetical protein
MMREVRLIARTSLAALAVALSSGTIAIRADQVTGQLAVDANGIVYHDFAGFAYVAERTDWRRNFRPDGSMRHDFLNVPHDNQCLVGYFKVSGPDNEEISTTLDVEIPFSEVGLKSPATPYVATIGHPEAAQATARIDAQGAGYEYKYVTYRKLERRSRSSETSIISRRPVD